MRSQLEDCLSHLEAPPAPRNLKARCLETIPRDVCDNKECPPRPTISGPFKTQRLGVAMLLLFSVSGAVAFWSTRPILDKTVGPTTASSGSAVFAQTVEAMRKVTRFRYRSRRLITEGQGWRSSLWAVTDDAFDSRRGLYRSRTQVRSATIPPSSQPPFKGLVLAPEAPPSNSHLRDEHLPGGRSRLDRSLQLPDGTLYKRRSMSGDLIINSDPQAWEYSNQQSADHSTLLRSGQVIPLASGSADFGGEGRLHALPLVDEVGDWKGLQTQVFAFRFDPSAENSGSPALRKEFYVEPNNHLVMAHQTFALFSDGSERLIQEGELDYLPQDAELFTPVALKVGARILDQR